MGVEWENGLRTRISLDITSEPTNNLVYLLWLWVRTWDPAKQGHSKREHHDKINGCCGYQVDKSNVMSKLCLLREMSEHDVNEAPTDGPLGWYGMAWDGIGQYDTVFGWWTMVNIYLLYYVTMSLLCRSPGPQDFDIFDPIIGNYETNSCDQNPKSWWDVTLPQ